MTMRRFFAVAAVSMAVLGTVAVSTGVSAEPEPRVDEALVNAKIDARLHQVLVGLLESRRAAGN
jgi:hypothetical protein